ncbi:MAG TPA: glycosyltransferase family 4 protein [Thermoanaerobaculia bacterium]
MKVLLAVSRYPWPARRGDQVRALQTLDSLSAEHEVTLLAPEPGPNDPSPPSAAYRIETYRRRRAGVAAGLGRALARRLPAQSGLFYQADLGHRLRELAPAADLGILQLVRLAVHLDDFGPLPLLVDLIDSLSLSVSRRAEVDRPLLRPALRLEARRLALWEDRLVERAAAVTVVCERDRQAIAGRLPPALAARVAVVRLAVEERNAAGLAPEPLVRPSSEGGPLLAMTGNLGYFVNADAVAWWLAEVWPALSRARPDVRVVVAGDRPPARLRRAIRRAGARLIESPPDLRAVLAQATLALAPMRCGAGVPVKVLEAWSVGVPVVATPWAAAGTTGRVGEDLRVVQRPAEWVSAILELLDDPAERRRLAANARRRLAADYSPGEVRRELAEIVRRSAPAAGGRGHGH